MSNKLFQSLINIQQTLNAPKNCVNRFGGYNYRNLEGIEESIKPLLKKENCGIRFADEVVEHCGRTFLKTTLYFFNVDGEVVSTTAEAEQEIEKKGMDKAQLTGATSSYARKYAMNAMFAIDDSKDADTNEFHNQTTASQPQPIAVPASSHRKVSTSYKPLPIEEQKIAELLAQCDTIDKMMKLYKENKDLVEGNADVKQMFSQHKKTLTA